MQLKNSPKISNLQVLSGHQKDLTLPSFPLFKDPVLPLFEGDDLRRLAQEITKARSFLWLARSFRYALKRHPRPGLRRGGAAPVQELLPCFSLGIRRPPSSISCPLGPNSRRNRTQSQRPLLCREVLSAKGSPPISRSPPSARQHTLLRGRDISGKGSEMTIPPYGEASYEEPLAKLTPSLRARCPGRP